MSKYHVPAEILQQAVDWLLKQQSATLTLKEQQEFERWLQQSEQHQRAWQCAEHFTATLASLPEQHSPEILQQAGKIQATQIIGKLMLVLSLPMLAYLSWQSNLRHQFFADYVSYTGQQKQVELSDGSQVYLNTQTAFDFTANMQQRHIDLHYGEIQIKTAKDHYTVKRPFLVETKHGVLEALGTVFNVQQIGDQTCVAVLEHAVKVTPYQLAPVIVQQNQQLCFNQHTYQPIQKINLNVQAWQQGLFFAYDLPLSQFVQEIQRYHKGYIYLDQDIADLRISGSYPVKDKAQMLHILAQTYPVQINTGLDGYIVTIKKKN